jgi:hypothetical protein
MTEFTIKAPALRQALTTALTFASTDDTIPLINSVFIQPAADGTAIEVAATDRYALSIETLPVEDDGTPFEVLIRSDIVKRILTLTPKPKRGEEPGTVTLTQDGDRVTVRVVTDIETAITFTPWKDKFIDYRKLLAGAEKDKSEPADLMGFNPSILGKTCKAFSGSSEPMKASFSGHGKAVLIEQGYSGLKVLVMPVRIHEYEKAQADKVAA